ncbi:MAG: winged helix-turn-helix domain-containing protein [Anaeromyxobacteraceae bacterium]
MDRTRSRPRTPRAPHAAALSLATLRRHAVAWQGYSTRFRRAGADDVLACVRRLSCVQLDSIATVARSHVLVLASRAGAVEDETVSGLLAAGRLFEYWAHEACLVPVEHWPLLRHRMRERRTHHWWGPVIDSDPALAARVLAEVRERGPLASRHFEGRGGGGMWRLKPAKRMLDALWTAGELVVAGRQGFQRLYDLPERVLPRAVLVAPEPTDDEAVRALVLRAVEGRGALTAHGVVDHYRFEGGTARVAPALAALCDAGVVREWAVADGGPPVYLPAACEPGAAEAPAGGVLLSPFENLLWDRDFTRRVLGFDHLIEVYKQQHQRVYGYYVLPFLLGDRVVGRLDLKARRDEGVLAVRAFHAEAGVRRTRRLAAALEGALARLARTIGLEAVEDAGAVARRGEAR